MTHVVTAPLIAVVASGVRHSLYAGATVPSGVKSEALERLEAEGYVSRVDGPAVECVEVEPVSAPSPAPAKSGPGSGKAAWRGYAESLGVDVPESADRDGIVRAVAAAGHPTE